MDSFSDIREIIDQFSFHERLSAQFVAVTGYGVFVYLNPLDVEQLYRRYLNHPTPIKDFLRQCVRNVLGR